MFSDVIGLDEAKQAIQERIIEPGKHPEIYKKYGYKAGGGILLYGLPGTGKTMFAQAVANELDGKFFSVKASDLKAKWYGETEEKIKKLFTEARQEKVSVIFIDEFEAIGMDRNKQTTDFTATTVVPELLAQMQGFEHDSENILLVIAATNRPWDIDSALTRPGRLDYKVYVELPNSECRKAMLKNYLKKVQVLDIAFNYLVEHTEGYNGADIKNVADALVKIVIKKEIDGVSNYHLDYKDAVSVLERIHSSVSKNDTYLMEIYRNNN
jgi:SpoVK/Ycf46/Vps4 family AAA+-type ATPase